MGAEEGGLFVEALEEVVTAFDSGFQRSLEPAIRAAQAQLAAQEAREREQQAELEKRRAEVFMPELLRAKEVIESRASGNG